MLKTDLDIGISGDDDELSQRKNAYGSNTYPVKKGRSYLVIFVYNCMTICSSET